MLMKKSFLKMVEDEYVVVVSKGSVASLEKNLEQREREPRAEEFTVFLSHKHDEHQELRQAAALLNSLGVSVYIDWMDVDMPRTTTGETAQKLKEKIEKCSKFIFLTTNDSILSPWCNWELGYGDAQKFPTENMTLLPVARDDGTWDHNEYLQIYPYIETQSNFPGSYVVKYGSKETALADWLRRQTWKNT
jgi:metal-dependent hydrolase (beta-lactamase superfamily II)